MDRFFIPKGASISYERPVVAEAQEEPRLEVSFSKIKEIIPRPTEEKELTIVDPYFLAKFKDIDELVAADQFIAFIKDISVKKLTIYTKESLHDSNFANGLRDKFGDTILQPY